MDERTIRKLKNKFILFSTLSFTIVMVFIAGCMYLSNAIITYREARMTLDYIVENDGDLPDYGKSGSDSSSTQDLEEKTGISIGSDNSTETGAAAESGSAGTAGVSGDQETTAESTDASSEGASADGSGDAVVEEAGSTFRADSGSSGSTGGTFAQQFTRSLENIFALGYNYTSPEFAYSTRYFAVIFDEDGDAAQVKTGHIAAVDKEEAVELARIAMERNRAIGRFGDYYYETRLRENGSTIVVILDCTDNVATTRRLLNLALILIGLGVLISGVVMRLLAGKVVQNEVRNVMNQKAFITNASHELKTPLAVIKANTEILEMTNGENEWTQSTLRQVDRMTGLIQNLVMITQAQEQDNRQNRVETDISKAIRETVKTFEPVATQDGKKIETEISENVKMLAEEGQIRQLTSLLVDNAIKYCDEGGTIRVSLGRKGRAGVRLVVSNPYAAGKDVDYTRFFERFYREDKSHNQDRGGYGIGLSIAENLVEQYHGTIRAAWADGIIYFTCVLN